jgi:hypothetical protein
VTPAAGNLAPSGPFGQAHIIRLVKPDRAVVGLSRRDVDRVTIYGHGGESSRAETARNGNPLTQPLLLVVRIRSVATLQIAIKVIC